MQSRPLLATGRLGRAGWEQLGASFYTYRKFGSSQVIFKSAQCFTNVLLKVKRNMKDVRF